MTRRERGNRTSHAARIHSEEFQQLTRDLSVNVRFTSYSLRFVVAASLGHRRPLKDTFYSITLYKVLIADVRTLVSFKHRKLRRIYAESQVGSHCSRRTRYTFPCQTKH